MREASSAAWRIALLAKKYLVYFQIWHGVHWNKSLKLPFGLHTVWVGRHEAQRWLMERSFQRVQHRAIFCSIWQSHNFLAYLHRTTARTFCVTLATGFFSRVSVINLLPFTFTTSTNPTICIPRSQLSFIAARCCSPPPLVITLDTCVS